MSDYTANIPSADNKRRAIPKKTRKDNVLSSLSYKNVESSWT